MIGGEAGRGAEPCALRRARSRAQHSANFRRSCALDRKHAADDLAGIRLAAVRIRLRHDESAA